MDKLLYERAKWKATLRGILCVPCAMLLGFLLSFIAYRWAYGVLIEGSLLELLPSYITEPVVLLLGSTVLGAVTTVTGAMIAPSGQKIVGLCITSLLIVMGAVGTAGAIMSGRYVNIAACIGFVLGAILVDFYLSSQEQDRIERRKHCYSCGNCIEDKIAFQRPDGNYLCEECARPISEDK